MPGSSHAEFRGIRIRISAGSGGTIGPLGHEDLLGPAGMTPAGRSSGFVDTAVHSPRRAPAGNPPAGAVDLESATHVSTGSTGSQCVASMNAVKRQVLLPGPAHPGAEAPAHPGSGASEPRQDPEAIQGRQQPDRHPAPSAPTSTAPTDPPLWTARPERTSSAIEEPTATGPATPSDKKRIFPPVPPA